MTNVNIWTRLCLIFTVKVFKAYEADMITVPQLKLPPQVNETTV